jgi:RNA polymerase sigma-70 factor (sigma-E family)
VEADAIDSVRPEVTGGARYSVTEARQAVSALYQAHAIGLMRLALIMLGDRPSAEDVVQDAFCGLYRRWRTLSDTEKALSYVRSSVLNGARTVLRRRARQPLGTEDRPVESAESAVLVFAEHQRVVDAIRRLPDRQREALVLRYYLDLSEEEIARAMAISRGTVKSTCSRALAALGRILEERQ